MTLKKSFLASLVSFFLAVTSPSNSDQIRINIGAISNNAVGDSYAYNYHQEGSLEGPDSNDVLRTTGSEKEQWFRIYTKIDNKEYIREFKPAQSEVLFTNYVQVIDNTRTGLSSRFKAKFSLSEEDSNRVYTARVTYPNYPQATITADIRDLIKTNQGNLVLGELTNAPNNQLCGIIEISSRFLQQPRIQSLTFPGNSLEASLQPATHFFLEENSNLEEPWKKHKETNYFRVSPENFNAIPSNNPLYLRTKIILTNKTEKTQEFYRIKARVD